MRRISTVSKVVDKFGPGKHGFTNGNALTGVPATELEDVFYDHVQEELCSIAEAAGIVVDGSSKTQVLNAILTLTKHPAGAVSYFATLSAPTGWLKCNGAAISRTAYSALFAAVGTVFGAGDGATTFNLPDLRGEFLRGFDDGRSIDSGRAFGSAQSATAIRTLLDIYNSPYMLSSAVVNIRNPDGTLSGVGSGSGSLGSDTLYVQNNGNIQAVGSGDNLAYSVRPRNVALLACIKY